MAESLQSVWAQLKLRLLRFPSTRRFFRAINQEVVVRLTDKRRFAVYRYMKALSRVSALIQTEGLSGGEFAENGDFFIRRGGGTLLFYNHSDARYTFGDGQSLEYVADARDEGLFEFFREVLTSGAVYLDVGANNGFYYAIRIARAFPHCRVFAFEPDPKILHHLEKNVRANGVSQVTVIRRGLLDLKGAVKMTESFGASNFILDGTTAKSTAIEISVERLDDFVAEEGLERVDLVKVDIEGSETRFLRGALDTLRRHRPYLMMEVRDEFLARAGSGVSELLEVTIRAGYRRYRITGTNDWMLVHESKVKEFEPHRRAWIEVS